MAAPAARDLSWLDATIDAILAENGLPPGARAAVCLRCRGVLGGDAAGNLYCACACAAGRPAPPPAPEEDPP